MVGYWQCWPVQLQAKRAASAVRGTYPGVPRCAVGFICTVHCVPACLCVAGVTCIFSFGMKMLEASYRGEQVDCA